MSIFGVGKALRGASAATKASKAAKAAKVAKAAEAAKGVAMASAKKGGAAARGMRPEREAYKGFAGKATGFYKTPDVENRGGSVFQHFVVNDMKGYQPSAAPAPAWKGIPYDYAPKSPSNKPMATKKKGK